MRLFIFVLFFIVVSCGGNEKIVYKYVDNTSVVDEEVDADFDDHELDTNGFDDHETDVDDIQDNPTVDEIQDSEDPDEIIDDVEYDSEVVDENDDENIDEFDNETIDDIEQPDEEIVYDCGDKKYVPSMGPLDTNDEVMLFQMGEYTYTEGNLEVNNIDDCDFLQTMK